MGASQGKTENKNVESYISTLNHPKLTYAKIIKDESDRDSPYIQLNTTIADENLYRKWEQLIREYSEPEGTVKTIYLPMQISFERKGMCGAAGNSTAKYELFPFVMKEELENRNQLRKPFAETELWYLIYLIASAGAFIHNKAKLIGDVRPANILISEGGEIQVISQASFFDEETNYRKTLTIKEITFLSPQQMNDLQEAKNQNFDPKNQCFSIGLTFLSAILLQDQSILYSQDFTFNQTQFQRELQRLRNAATYHPLMRKLIEGLLTVDPQKRLTCLQVLQWLKPVERQIMDLQAFDPSEIFIPQSVQEKLNISNQNGLRRSERGRHSRVIGVPDTVDYSHFGGANQKSHIFDHKESIYSQQVFMPSSRSVQAEQGGKIIYQPQYVEETRRDNSVRGGYHPQPPYFPHTHVVNTQSVYSPPENFRRVEDPEPIRYVQNKPQFEKPRESITNVRPIGFQSNYQQSYVSSGSEGFSYPPTQNYSHNPNYNHNNSHNNHVLVSHNSNLAEMGRQATSIRPQQSRDRVFDSYNEVINDIDKQVAESRRLFPEGGS